MRNILILLAFFALIGTGCKDKVERPAPDRDTASESNDLAGESSRAATDPLTRPGPKRITPERIAEIKASGRTGFWSQVTEVCPGTREVTTLTWNIADEPENRFVVYVVDKDGTERNFGQGGAVGEKRTGPWLRPGLQFKLRSMGDKREVGVVEIGSKADC